METRKTGDDTDRNTATATSMVSPLIMRMRTMMRTCVICLMIRVQTRKIVKNTADVLSLLSSFLVS